MDRALGATAAKVPRDLRSNTPASRGRSAIDPRSPFRSSHGITIVSAAHPEPDHWGLTFTTPAIDGLLHVDVQLPRGYAHSNRRYPVLYAFHGTGGGASDFTGADIHDLVAEHPLILVSADGGINRNGGGWFTNWLDQTTKLGAANWETFHIHQLIPWIDSSLRTIAHRRGRAITGVSQGAFGAMSYAARHPDLFGAAGSFSGPLDVAEKPEAQLVGGGLVMSLVLALDGVSPLAPFGDPVTDHLNWQGHNPASLVSNLTHTGLRFWCGNGLPGPLDDPTDPTADSGLVVGVPIETIVHTSMGYFIEAAERIGLKYRYDDYGAGTHAWPYAVRDFSQFLPWVAHYFAHPPRAPRSISYRSIDPRWTQWGWRAVLDSATPQWSRLANARPRGFTWLGPAVTLRTPAVYRPGRYRVSVDHGRGSGVVRADPHGRLTMHVTPDADGEPAVVRVSAVGR
jgi:S-formylglutathione hydrolase FrmB